VEIEEAVVSFARAVLKEEGTVVFGAHPSISPLVASVASEYLSPRLRTGAPPEVESIGKPERSGPGVVIYQSHAYDGQLPDKTWEMYRLGFADLVWCGAKGGEQFDPKNPRVQCPLSLLFMREQMIGRESPCAMVAIGGMEGVIEEAHIFLGDKPLRAPLYLMETTGGAAEQLAREPIGPCRAGMEGRLAARARRNNFALGSSCPALCAIPAAHAMAGATNRERAPGLSSNRSISVWLRRRARITSQQASWRRLSVCCAETLDS
jgi:hypothetical protein